MLQGCDLLARQHWRVRELKRPLGWGLDGRF